MDSALQKDRRIFERIDVEFPVDIKYHEGKKEAKCQCFNIGASGMGVVCDAKLTRDKDVKVTMHIPDTHEPQSMYAKVAWTKDGTIGLEFSGLSFESVDLFKFWRIFRLPGVRKPAF